MKNLVVFLFFILQHVLYAQITIVVKNIPANTPEGSKIYLAGNLNNWNPSDSNYILQSDGSNNYSIVIPERTSSIEFKFTRGSWSTAEGNNSGSFLPNRTLSFTGTPQTIELSIASWEDLSGSTPTSTAAKNVSILNSSFYIPQLNRYRKIWLYLPPDYNTSDKKYPVLYLHDGQNLFDSSTSFSGEWGIDETLNNLHNRGDFGAIVIGIENGGADRINEYTPWVNSKYGGGQGDAYVQFIVETLKPFIDSKYRTLTEAKYTVLGGSSLGGLISIYGVCKFPNVFGKILNFSPAYWINEPELNSFIQNQNIDLINQKIYTIAGQKESATITTEVNSVQDELLAKNISASHSLIKIDADGTHSESYWNREFGAAYQWLFSEENLSVSSFKKKRLNLIGDQNNIWVEGLESENEIFMIYDLSGKHFETIVLKNGKNILKTNYSNGIYLVKSKQGLYETVKISFTP